MTTPQHPQAVTKGGGKLPPPLPKNSWTESWVPELSRLLSSLVDNRPDGRTGKIGSMRTVSELFRQELKAEFERGREAERKKIVKAIKKLQEEMMWREDSIGYHVLKSLVEKLLTPSDGADTKE